MFQEEDLYIIDANVLVGVTKRTILFSLLRSGVLNAKWSDRVLQEARSALVRISIRRGHGEEFARNRSARIMENIENSFESSKLPPVPSGFQLVGLPDEDDEHVVQIAMFAKAKFIMTDNIRDFPEQLLSPLGISAIRPDDVFAMYVRHHWETVRSALPQINEDLNVSNVDENEMLERWSVEIGLKNTVTEIRNRIRNET